jgi:ketosteroid isomerase-like protein
VRSERPERSEHVTDRLERERQTAATLAAIERFNAAFNRHDVDAVMALMTDDCVFENTFPPPDGERFVGQAAVRGFWERFFASSPTAHFTTEDAFAAGDRCLVRWVYRWGGPGEGGGHVRGVDVFRVRDGKVAEKLSYVKG